MKVKNPILWVIALYIFLITTWRAYIIYWGYKKLGRMATYADGLRIEKPILFSHQTDGMLLGLTNLFTFTLIFCLIVYFSFKVFQNQFSDIKKPYIVLAILIVIELIIWTHPGFSYAMLD